MRPVTIAQPSRAQITPSSTMRALVVVLTLIDSFGAGERERILRSVCFYFGYRLARAADHSIIP